MHEPEPFSGHRPGERPFVASAILLLDAPGRDGRALATPGPDTWRAGTVRWSLPTPLPLLARRERARRFPDTDARPIDVVQVESVQVGGFSHVEKVTGLVRGVGTLDLALLHQVRPDLARLLAAGERVGLQAQITASTLRLVEPYAPSVASPHYRYTAHGRDLSEDELVAMLAREPGLPFTAVAHDWSLAGAYLSTVDTTGWPGVGLRLRDTAATTQDPPVA